LGALAGLALVFGGFLIWRVVEVRRLESDSEYAAAQVVREVGRHMILPEGEKPAVVTVVDKAKVKNISFLERSAQNGDKLLVYAKARKVVLYRPSKQRIVDVGPVSIAQPGTQK
jgi:hypothetical protein